MNEVYVAFFAVVWCAAVWFYVQRQKLVHPKLFDTERTDELLRKYVPFSGVLMILGAIVSHLHFSSLPGEGFAEAPIPFVSDPMKPFFVQGQAVSSLVIGVGFLLRLRAAWYLFLVVSFAGFAFGIAGTAIDDQLHDAKAIMIPIVTLMSVATFVLMYRLTRPAFEKAGS